MMPPRWPSAHARTTALHVVLLVIAAVLALAALVAAPPAASADALDDQVREIARTLRCPICENVSVADSQSELAAQMRQVIREQLQQGRTREQIVSYFVERYGESVLFDPPKRGFSLLVWAITPLGVLVGGTVVWRLVRRAARIGPPHRPAPHAAGRDSDDDSLAPYRARVRAELAALAKEGA